MDLEVFEGTEQLLGKARTVGTVYFEQQDGKVATDSETP